MADVCAVTGTTLDIAGELIPNASFAIVRKGRLTVAGGSGEISVGAHLTVVSNASGVLGVAPDGVFSAGFDLVQGYEYEVTPYVNNGGGVLPKFLLGVTEGTTSATIDELIQEPGSAAFNGSAAQSAAEAALSAEAAENAQTAAEDAQTAAEAARDIAISGSLSVYPDQGSWTAAEQRALPALLDYELYGADPAKIYGVHFLWWKDVGSRFRLAIWEADDADGTNAAIVTDYTLGSGADTWDTIRRVELDQVLGSGVTGWALVDFRDTSAMNLNGAPSVAADYNRRQLASIGIRGGDNRDDDITRGAMAGIPIYDSSGTLSFFVKGGNDSLSGDANTGVGYTALGSLTSGGFNSAFGRASLETLTTGNFNTAFGTQSLTDLLNGASNTAIGFRSGYTMSSGSNNTLIGGTAGAAVTTGGHHVAVGASALSSMTVQSASVAVGSGALQNYTGFGAVAVGYEAAKEATTLAYLTAVGRGAAQLRTTGNDCSFFGHQAGYGFSGAPTGEGNTGLGAYSLGHATTGAYNTGCGRASLWYVTEGNNNTGVGFRAGYGTGEGDGNAWFGFYSGHNSQTGNRNIGLGALSDVYYPAAGSFSATAVLGSGLTAGDYAYRVSFVLDGVETAPSEPANVTTAGGNLQVDLADIPVYSGPLTCTARRVYRTPEGGENLYYLVAEIGDNVTTSYSDTTPDGSLGARPVGIGASIALGYGARVVKSNQAVIGSTDARVTSVVIGGGVEDTSPADVTVEASGASGTDTAGSALRLSGGKGTGAAKSGSVILSAGAAGSAGSSHNAVADWVTLDGAGFLNIRETTSAAVATPSAGSVNLFVEGGSLKFKNSAGTVLTVTAT
jgi:hypothetical protein